MRKLALRAQALYWNINKLNREVDQMAYLFPEIPEEDREKYLIKTCIHHIPGVGYKPPFANHRRDSQESEPEVPDPRCALPD
jgi:hypothetical protein